MKHINRSSPLSHFTYFVAKKPKQWKDLAINNYMLYDDCRKTLAQDQDGKSGYTELPLTKKPNVWHIDHFLKQDHFPRHIFDWQNLIVDNHSKTFGADFKDSYIKKKDENIRLINPVTEEPEDFFTYMANGKIVPRDNLSDYDRSRAIYTIQAFNLNHPELIKIRTELDKSIKTYKAGGLDDDEITMALNKNYGLDTFVKYVLAYI